MTLTDIVFAFGLALVIIAVLVVGTLAVAAYTRPRGAHHPHVTDEEAPWPPELPPRFPASPERPDGRPA